MSLRSDYVEATLDARPLVNDYEWEKRCDAWIKKTIRHAVLEELEAKIDALSLTNGKYKAREDCERGYEVAKDDVFSLLAQMKEGLK